MTNHPFYDIVILEDLQLKGGVLQIYDRTVALLRKEEKVSDQAFVNVLEMVVAASSDEHDFRRVTLFLEEAQIHGGNISLFWEMCDKDIKKVFACIAITEIYGKKDYSKEAMKKHVIEKNKPFFNQFFERTKGRLL